MAAALDLRLAPAGRTRLGWVSPAAVLLCLAALTLLRLI